MVEDQTLKLAAGRLWEALDRLIIDYERQGLPASPAYLSAKQMRHNMRAFSGTAGQPA
jgi:hypothetical protein